MFKFSFGDSQDSYICGTSKEWKWMGIPTGLSTVLDTYATDILGVAIGLHGSYWIRYEGKDGAIHRQWFGLPPRLEDDMRKEQPLEVCLGPNGSWFWCNDHKCKRFLHLPVLEAAVKSRLDEVPGTLKWVTMGKTSGVALFKDGFWKSHNAPAGLTRAMKSAGKVIDKVYLSPVDDIHYVLKWQDGSFSYSLPHNWAADLDSLIRNYSSLNSHAVAERDRQSLSAPGQGTVVRQGLSTTEIEAPPGTKALNDGLTLPQRIPLRRSSTIRGTEAQKAADTRPIYNGNRLKRGHDLHQLINEIVRAPVVPPHTSVLVGLNDSNTNINSPSISPQFNAIEWNRLNRKQVSAIARSLLVQAAITSYETSKIYPRLSLYTLACVMSSSYIPEGAHNSQLHNILQVLESWDAWDDVTALAHHEKVREYLLTCLESTNQLRDIQSDALEKKTPRKILRQVLALDANAIDVLLLATLQDRVKFRYFVKRHDQEAQSLLNLLQARLGFPLDTSLKHLHISALIKLSRASGLYPECMTLKGIKLVGDAAIDGGGYGDIWKGLLNGQEIAVKVLRIFHKSDKNKLLKEFCSEAVLWRQLNHPNVLPFYGVFRLEDDRLCFASPWMINGNIVHFLELAPETNCVPLILDIAEGLYYLHTLSPRIIHGDIKGVNILITPSRRACLADFGLSTTSDSQSFPFTSAASTRVKGTLRWQAPELLDPEMDDASCANTLASDVYAYACVCYEIFTGRVPFQEIKNDFRVMTAVREGKRPSRPLDYRCRIRGLDDDIWTMVQSCWAQNPDRRPTAYGIIQQLCSFPTQVVDMRPVDLFDPSFPSRTLYVQAEHPFSALPPATNGRRAVASY